MRVYYLEPAPIKKSVIFLQKVCNLQNNDYLCINLININIMIEKFTIYLGLNDQTTKRQEIETVNAYKIVSNMIASTFGGGSIYSGTGIYKHQDGTITEENNFKIELLFASRPAVLAFCEDLKKVFNQESVALQYDRIESELI